MNRDLIRDVVNVQRGIGQINSEIPDAGITLTRTAIQAITTAGTIIVWQSRIRGQGITWSGSTITIPAAGWYIITCAFQFGSLNDLLVRLIVNGQGVQFASTIGDVNRDVATCTFLRYYVRSDTIQIQLEPSGNVNLNARAEGGLAESPILHIVQLSNQAEV